MVKRYFKYIYNSAFEHNKRNILKLLESEHGSRLCDLGCDDGEWTIKLAKTVKAKEVFGLEIVRSQAEKAMKRGIKVKIGDLNNSLPFSDSFF